ncbi:hypothetical protein [Kineococcus esterisolvens]|uniref:hypothetical protein n=1 Tax=unclassified Kineococcus TaxID=2621656 RepID=UPI003D7DBA7E
MRSSYEIAGTDLSSFVETWLAEVDAASDTGPLHLAVDDPVEKDRYFYGMAGLMFFIGPRVASEASTREELLLYGVLLCYHQHLDSHPAATWPGPRPHVQRAFEHAREVGEKAVADCLRQQVAHHGTRHEGDEELDELMWSGKSPAQRAAHEQTMVGSDLRDLRAAKAFDGTDGDPWDIMPSV